MGVMPITALLPSNITIVIGTAGLSLSSMSLGVSMGSHSESTSITSQFISSSAQTHSTTLGVLPSVLWSDTDDQDTAGTAQGAPALTRSIMSLHEDTVPTGSKGPGDQSPQTTQTTPKINFLLNTLITCEPGLIRWSTSSDINDIVFSITISTTTGIETKVPLAKALNASSLEYTWPNVILPQGRYVLNALDDNTERIGTGTVLVENGADTTCLRGDTILDDTSIKRPTQSTTSSLSPSVTSRDTPPASGSTRSIIIGATVGSTMFTVALVFYLFRHRLLNREGRTIHIAPYRQSTTEHPKRSAINNVDHEIEANNDFPPSPNEVQPIVASRLAQPRIFRHEDSGWRPQQIGSLPQSEMEEIDCIHMPPEYESAV
ncbi:hypothetical protein VNI00_016684 [Paramarasmius palmivorus]|uniref:Uncharacterized protein n=1 Tax=Paramarasmius palmivorus TaxID=297713 RepID=A0AAW0BBN1_9AGAR